jgi:AcrR family transcriptional regulator
VRPRTPAGEAHTGSRVERRKRETRDRLLRAAFRLFAERGADAVAINEITEAADVGFGSFYNHFASKEAIYEEVLREMFEEFGLGIERLTTGIDDPAHVISIAVRQTVRRAEREPLWGKLLIREGYQRRVFMGSLGPRLLRDIARGVESGRFRSSDLLLTFIVVGSGVLGAVSAQIQLTAEDEATLTAFGMRSGDLPERTAATLLHALGLPYATADSIARRPFPAEPPLP